MNRFRAAICLEAMLAFVAAATLLTCTPAARAQSTVLTEGFEGAFPGATWTVADTNAAAGLAFWDDVPFLFGGEGAHGGSWKGYCAGTGYLGVSTAPLYTNSMDSQMSATINLTPYSRANLRFWYRIPSIETNFDFARVYIDNTLVWSSTLPATNWTEADINLNAFAGAIRTLKFLFHSDSTVVYEGWYLDDIEVTGGTTPYTNTLVGLSLTNYTGYVIDSDGSPTNGPNYNRESLLLNTVLHTENFQTISTNVSYQFVYRVRDTNGTLLPIVDITGATNTTFTSTNTLTLAQSTETNITNFASIRPAARMNHLTRYNIEVDVARVGSGVLFQATNGPLQFYHFTNTVSGDASYNVIAEFGGSTIERSWLIDLAPGSNTFTVTNLVAMKRYDDFSLVFPNAAAVPVRLDVELRHATNNSIIPLVNSFSNYTVNIGGFTVGSDPTEPAGTTNILALNVRPASQLNSVDTTYRLIVRMTYTNIVGQPGIAAGSITNGPTRFLAFNGKLAFGDIATTFNALSSAPTPGAATLGNYIAANVPVANNAGTINTETNSHYGNGSILPVNLLVNGDAIYIGMPISFNGPTDDSSGNVRFQRSGQYLDTAGAHANINFIMPAGFGYNTNVAEAVFQHRMLSDLSFSNIGLNQSLAPKSNLVFAASVLATEETKPLWIVASSIQWDQANNQFLLPIAGTQLQHVRGFDYAGLMAQMTNLYDTNMAVKLSNDKYFNFADTVSGTPSVRANGQGHALLTMDINFTAGSFRTHFPYNATITWSNASTMKVVDDLVSVGAGSRLVGVAPVMTPYVSDCEGCSGIGSTNLIGLQPPGAELYFTRDGGLVTSGATSPLYATLGAPIVSNKLAWGYVPSASAHAQSVLSPTNAAFHMPGAFLRGTENTSSSDNGPAVILYTGVAATNFNVIERPSTAGYLVGRADYAGLNIRVLGDNFLDGKSLIAGQNVAYKLRGNSKYYARLGGVSGIHSATGGSFPTNLTLLGYSFTFSNYSLSYLDGENLKSRTEGSVYLPYPSDITLKFKELTFTCPGGLDKAEIQQGSSTNVLAYWNADIEALGIQFVSNPGQECAPGTGWLTVGVNGWSAYVEDALHGTLGFNPNGTLIAKSQGVDGVDSRLQMPGSFKMKGPNSRDYVINPVGNAYYNKYDPAKVELGFITFAGKMNIPFFEDLKVQVQTTPKKGNTNSSVFLMGGWPRVGSGRPNLGWVDGSSKDFFSAAYFDPNNSGFPTSLANVGAYRNSPTTMYHPRAVKSWLDIVEFDYPLVWNYSLRSFKSFSTITNDLIVIKAQHEVTYMDAKTASIDFGIKYDGLPKVSIANFLINELDEVTGVFSAISNTISGAATEVLDKGLEGLNTLLNDSADKLVDELFDAAIDPLLDPAYDALKQTYDNLSPANKLQFPLQAQSNLLALANNISNALLKANSAIAGGGQLLQNIDGKIVDATNAIGTVANLLTQGPKVASMVDNLVNTFASQFSDSVIDPSLSDAIAQVQPSINAVKSTLQDVQGVVGQLRGPLQQGAEWQQELQQTFQSGASSINGAMDAGRNAMNTFFNTFNYAVDNPFTHYSKAELKKKLRKEFKEEFMGTKVVADLQNGIKQRLYDLDAQFKQGMDSYFQQVNQVMRDLISQSFSGLDDKINKGLGTLNQYMGSGKISGHAVINDDSLRYLRIDGHFEWSVPEKMEFNAFLEVKEIDSENTSESCIPAGGSATEVKLGANDVDLKWISPGLRADIQVQFVIGNDGTPRGIGGAFQTRGDLTFGGFTVKSVGFAVAFGETENYIAANVRAAFGGSVEIAGGVFFGKACDFTPLRTAVTAVSPALLNDLDPQELFGSPPFTGAFVYAEGTFPIWSIGCLFEVRVTVGAGAWYFVEGPKYGGLFKAGVSGTVICVLSASGDITLIGSKKPEGMTFVGTAHVEGCFGPCPFCICVDTSTSVKYVEGNDWDAKDPH